LNEIWLLQIVAHASTVDLAIGAFRDPPRTIHTHELNNAFSCYPHCCTAIIERSPDGRWEYHEGALPHITDKKLCSKIDRNFAYRSDSAAMKETVATGEGHSGSHSP
uniref:Methylcytosine dioxygenase TET n=1 Tax=Gongylonema pulchrum TaxID=637853 RepID=A0A183DLH6_9BILA